MMAKQRPSYRSKAEINISILDYLAYDGRPVTISKLGLITRLSYPALKTYLAPIIKSKIVSEYHGNEERYASHTFLITPEGRKVYSRYLELVDEIKKLGLTI